MAALGWQASAGPGAALEPQCPIGCGQQRWPHGAWAHNGAHNIDIASAQASVRLARTPAIDNTRTP